MIHSGSEMTDFRKRYFRALATKTFGKETRWLKSTGSTNEVAGSWAADGISEGAMVFADNQTAGKGRHGRTWRVSPGMNLTISLVLRPRMAPDRLGLISLAAGVAVADCIESCYPGIGVGLKWPNDVRIEDRKCCGILLESACLSGKDDQVVILGIGLNVNQREFEGDLSETATSIALATGRLADRVQILVRLLISLEERYGQLTREPERIIDDYGLLLDGMGRRVRIQETPGRAADAGILVGVDDTGALILETKDGPKTYHAGDVTLSAGGLCG